MYYVLCYHYFVFNFVSIFVSYSFFFYFVHYINILSKQFVWIFFIRSIVYAYSLFVFRSLYKYFVHTVCLYFVHCINILYYNRSIVPLVWYFHINILPQGFWHTLYNHQIEMIIKCRISYYKFIKKSFFKLPLNF